MEGGSRVVGVEDIQARPLRRLLLGALLPALLIGAVVLGFTNSADTPAGHRSDRHCPYDFG
ncbi:MAG TPA: hypothetical protein VH166_11420 [Mycobacterium sp.]|nr:hypothetical protein [Mycobacterium sp.]